MNSIDVIGYIRNNLGDGYRKIEVGLPTFNDDGKNTTEIIAKYWAGGDRNYFLVLPENSHVAIRGHLDYDEKFGTIVIAEQLYCLKKPLWSYWGILKLLLLQDPW